MKRGRGRAGAPTSTAKAAAASKVSVRYLSCGDTAFTVEFANEVSPEINGRVIALHAAIGRARAAVELAGLVGTVPTMRSLMATYDPLLTSRATLQPAIESMLEHGLAVESTRRDVTIPCCYDDPDFAPDLQEVAERTGKILRAGDRRPPRVGVQGLPPGLHAGPGLYRRSRSVAGPAEAR